MTSESHPPADLTEFERRCVEAGLPVTAQRRAVFEALAPRTDHPTVDEVYSAVQERLRGVSKATVYRTLEKLTELGLANRVAHPGSTARFDPNTTLHHHLVCDVCGKIADCEDEDAITLRLPATEFDVREASVVVRGTCADCR